MRALTSNHTLIRHGQIEIVLKISNRRRWIRRRYRYVWHKMCGVLSIAITKRFKRPRVKLTRAKLEKRAKLSRAKLASRRSGTRPARSRQTGTRQKGRAKVEWNLFIYIFEGPVSFRIDENRLDECFRFYSWNLDYESMMQYFLIMHILFNYFNKSFHVYQHVCDIPEVFTWSRLAIESRLTYSARLFAFRSLSRSIWGFL